MIVKIGIYKIYENGLVQINIRTNLKGVEEKITKA